MKELEKYKPEEIAEACKNLMQDPHWLIVREAIADDIKVVETEICNTRFKNIHELHLKQEQREWMLMFYHLGENLLDTVQNRLETELPLDPYPTLEDNEETAS